MINKKLILSSEQMRTEALPQLNITQVKQVLAMYTPTGPSDPHSFLQAGPQYSFIICHTDLEERISLADIQKLDRGVRIRSQGENLLLDSTRLFPLTPADLHYLELGDASNIPFPFEIKQKIHDVVEQVLINHSTAIDRRCQG